MVQTSEDACDTLPVGLVALVTDTVTNLGFSSYLILAMADPGSPLSTRASAHNLSEQHAQYLVHAVQGKDPLLGQCCRPPVLVLWDHAAYEGAGRLREWQALQDMAAGTGIAQSLVVSNRTLVLSAQRVGPVAESTRALNAVLASFQRLALEVAGTIQAAAAQREEAMNLTPRELDCIRWTMLGKTAGEVGSILAITERTVNKHLAGAMAKLGVFQKHQAVQRANAAYQLG